MPQEFSAGIVPFRNPEKPEFLLLKYPGGYWGFPRGHIEKEENSRETALREFREETGLGIRKFFEGFREVSEWFYRKEGKTIHKEAVFFLAETEKGTPELTEHSSYSWETFEEALAKLKFRNDKEILKKAHSFLKDYCKKD